MKTKFILLILLITTMIIKTNLSFANIQPLKVSSNGRFLVTEDGNPVFLNGDTCWQIPWKLKKEDVNTYLNKRQEQKFNAIGVDAFPDEKAPANRYGKYPFEIINGKYDPLKPVIKKGYDYWDHLEYIIDEAAKRGIYVILLPTWGSRIAGDWGNGKPNSAVLFDESSAYKYGKWIANRFKNKNNIIWMTGGDRSAIYGKYDYRKIFNSLAKGLIAGSGNKKILISYHPRKWLPNSSKWFHNEPWLSFNSIQDQPSDQVKAIVHDWNLKPAKPTWLFEGGYEGREKPDGTFVKGKKHFSRYSAKQVRSQAYQTVFAGGFGETYGNMSIWNFSKDWKKRIDDPGANQLKYLVKLMSLMSKEQYLSREMDQSILRCDTGEMSGPEGMFSTRIIAFRTKSRDLAMIYTAGSKNITVKMSLLKGPKVFVYWFNPRTGKWKYRNEEVDKPAPDEKPPAPSGEKALDYQFYIPGIHTTSNDWVLILSNKELKNEGIKK